jgi:hypothetical protein
MKYHLYLNRIDNTTVIIADNLRDLFVKTLTNMGAEPKHVQSSYILDELVAIADKVGIERVDIYSLN